MVHQISEETIIGKVFLVALDGAKRVRVVETQGNKCLCTFLDDSIENMFFEREQLFSIHSLPFCMTEWKRISQNYTYLEKTDFIPLESISFFLLYKHPKLGAKGLGRFHRVTICYLHGGYIYWNEIAGYHFMKKGTVEDYYLLVENFKKNIDCDFQIEDKTKPLFKNMYYLPSESRYAEWDYVRLCKGEY